MIQISTKSFCFQQIAFQLLKVTRILFFTPRNSLIQLPIEIQNHILNFVDSSRILSAEQEQAVLKFARDRKTLDKRITKSIFLESTMTNKIYVKRPSRHCVDDKRYNGGEVYTPCNLL